MQFLNWIRTRLTGNKGRVTLSVLAVLLAVGLVLGTAGVPFPSEAQAAANLQVHYIDVGQADAFLVMLPNGQKMMIDGGNNADSTLVVNYLKNKGVSRVDYVVGTHPHEDHIGGLDAVINNFAIGKVYLPNKTSTSQTYLDLINAINGKGLTITRAKKDVTILNTTVDGNTIKAYFVGPVKDSYSNTNDYSAVVRLIYGSTTFLFSGDAEVAAETDMVNSGQVLSAKIFKVGHHGSDTSTTTAYLNKVAPQAAIISVGAGNSYGHPAASTIQKLKNKGVKIWRTDINGTIIFTTSGSGWLVNKSPWWQP